MYSLIFHVILLCIRHPGVDEKHILKCEVCYSTLSQCHSQKYDTVYRALFLLICLYKSFTQLQARKQVETDLMGYALEWYNVVG